MKQLNTDGIRLVYEHNAKLRELEESESETCSFWESIDWVQCSLILLMGILFIITIMF